MDEDNNLAIKYPEIAKQWHPTNNGVLTPLDVPYGAGKKVWWKCPVAEDHEWEASLNSRTSRGKSKCPYCVGQRTSVSNCLATKSPETAKRWHPTKNGKLTPFDVTSGSGIACWWRCPVADDHEWKAAVNSRSKCPCCDGKKVVSSNCLSTVYPEIAEEWHPTKNGKLTPCKVTSAASKRVWWKGKCGHEWKTGIANRTRGKTNCPYCSNKKICTDNSLATTHPEIASQWHPTKNGRLTPLKISYGTDRKVWWKGVCGHEWRARVLCMSRNRSLYKGNGCPYCHGLKVDISNCLSTINPKLASEWHPIKNGKLTPFKVAPNSSRSKVWWKCEKGHSYQSYINSRNKKINPSGCPLCKKKRQTLLYKIVVAMRYPNINDDAISDKVKYDKYHPESKKLTGSYHQLDIWMPELNEAWEYQGEQHYGLIKTKYFKKKYPATIIKDKIKREMCEKLGIKLHIIDYRWDGTKEQLEKYMSGEIKPLIVK